jgi:hypothetical protein
MQIKNRHTQEEKPVFFHSWYYGLPNKKDFIIVDWDLVFWQTIKDGKRKDEKVIDRDHALRIIKRDDIINTMRELTDAEWSSLRNQFYDSPEFLSTAEKKQIFKSKELIKNCYKEGLYFDDFYMNHLGKKLTRDSAKRYLIELHKDGEINSLPHDMQSLSESDLPGKSLNQDSNLAPSKKEEIIIVANQKKKPNSVVKFIKSNIVGIGIFIIALLSLLTVRGCV